MVFDELFGKACSYCKKREINLAICVECILEMKVIPRVKAALPLSSCHLCRRSLPESKLLLFHYDCKEKLGHNHNERFAERYRGLGYKINEDTWACAEKPERGKEVARRLEEVGLLKKKSTKEINTGCLDAMGNPVVVEVGLWKVEY